MHVTADLTGVSAKQLADGALLSGLLIAAAGAAGVHPIGMPLVREAPNGTRAAVVLHEDCHIVAHAFPDRELLLVDVLLPRGTDCRRALDVFTRRLAAREVRCETRERG